MCILAFLCYNKLHYERPVWLGTARGAAVLQVQAGLTSPTYTGVFATLKCKREDHGQWQISSSSLAFTALTDIQVIQLLFGVPFLANFGTHLVWAATGLVNQVSAVIQIDIVTPCYFGYYAAKRRLRFLSSFFRPFCVCH